MTDTLLHALIGFTIGAGIGFAVFTPYYRRKLRREREEWLHRFREEMAHGRQELERPKERH